jgi:hypothetical protein
MDMIKVAAYKAEISALRSFVDSITPMAGPLNAASFPVTGSMVTVHTLPMVAAIIQRQNEAMGKMLNLMEKIASDI